MKPKYDPPEVVIVSDETQKATIEFIESLGLKPNQTGDMTVTVTMPVSGVVAFEVQVHMWATEEQLRKLAAATGKMDGRILAEIFNAEQPTAADIRRLESIVRREEEPE